MYIYTCIQIHTWKRTFHFNCLKSFVWEDYVALGEVGGWGRDPKKCMGRDWGMGSSTIWWNLRPVFKYHLRRGVGLIKFLENGSRPQPPTSLRWRGGFCNVSTPHHPCHRHWPKSLYWVTYLYIHIYIYMSVLHKCIESTPSMPSQGTKVSFLCYIFMCKYVYVWVTYMFRYI